MTDRLSKEQRSWNMSRIRGKDTRPERTVRSLLHRLGYRFRLHRKNLPGKPDIILPRHKTIIFVHGCFWHQHKGCKEATMPKSRTEWWQEKLEGNAARDKRNKAELRRAGWRVLTVWECETHCPEKLVCRLRRLGGGP